MTLHCPWCGNALTRQERGYLACEDGQMGLSAHLEKRLREVFVDQAVHQEARRMTSWPNGIVLDAVFRSFATPRAKSAV